MTTAHQFATTLLASHRVCLATDLADAVCLPAPDRITSALSAAGVTDPVGSAIAEAVDIDGPLRGLREERLAAADDIDFNGPFYTLEEVEERRAASRQSFTARLVAIHAYPHEVRCVVMHRDVARRAVHELADLQWLGSLMGRDVVLRGGRIHGALTRLLDDASPILRDLLRHGSPAKFSDETKARLAAASDGPSPDALSHEEVGRQLAEHPYFRHATDADFPPEADAIYAEGTRQLAEHGPVPIDSLLASIPDAVRERFPDAKLAAMTEAGREHMAAVRRENAQSEPVPAEEIEALIGTFTNGSETGRSCQCVEVYTDSRRVGRATHPECPVHGGVDGGEA